MKIPTTNFSPEEKPAYEKLVKEFPKAKLSIGPASDFDRPEIIRPIATDFCLFRGTKSLPDTFWPRFKEIRKELGLICSWESK